MTICKQLELSDIELGQIIEAVTVRCTETHRAAPSYSNELFELLVKLKYSTSRPAHVVPSDDGDGAPLERHYPRYESLKETVPVLDHDIPPIFNQISLTEIHVDPDLPFCPACELAQIDISAPYACQCEDF